jgi:hypothetical protein
MMRLWRVCRFICEMADGIWRSLALREHIVENIRYISDRTAKGPLDFDGPFADVHVKMSVVRSLPRFTSSGCGPRAEHSTR